MNFESIEAVITMAIIFGVVAGLVFVLDAR